VRRYYAAYRFVNGVDACLPPKQQSFLTAGLLARSSRFVFPGSCLDMWPVPVVNAMGVKPRYGRIRRLVPPALDCKNVDELLASYPRAHDKSYHEQRQLHIENG